MFKHLVQIALLPLVLTGCATTSLFSPYPNQIATIQTSLNAGTGDQSLIALSPKAESGSDALLYRLERGRLTQLLEKFEDSKADFEWIGNAFDQGDMKATVQASSLVSGMATMVTNDNAVGYSGEPFERVFAHAFQAFNFLALKQINSAEVELRRAADQQRNLAEKNEVEIAKAQKEAAEKKIPLNTVAGHFAGLDEVAGQVKSSFQNAYVLFLSGAVWEARGEWGRAAVDYRQALEMYPSNTELQAALNRAEKRIRPKSNGTVVFLYEEGFAPKKDEIKVPIPTFTGAIVTLAFPTYHASSQAPYGGLAVSHGSQSKSLPMLTNVGALAARSLKEKVPGMIVRQTLRAVTKHQIQKQAGDHFGPLGQLAGNVYNFVSESADLRSWLLLPAYTAAMQMELPPGEQSVNLMAPGVSMSHKVDVKPRKTTLVRVVNTRSRLFIQTFEL